MSKQHHKEMYTLIAGTGEKLVFNRPNQERNEESRAVVFHAFQSTIRSHFSVLPISTPFWFSVFFLGFRSFSIGPDSAVREIGGKKIGESQKSRRAKRTELKSGEGKGGALPPFPVHRSARFAHRFFFCWQSWYICLSSKHSFTFYSWLFTLYKNLTRPWLLTLLQAVKNSLSEIGSLRYERNKFERRPFGGSLVIFTPKKHQQ